MKSNFHNSHFLIAAILLALLVTSCFKKTPPPPNILFIMTDDHALQAVSAYSMELNYTPNIDRIANEGLRFQHCLVTNSICAPSRAVILTGKHSHINGVIDNSTSFDGSQQTFPKLLQEAGYQTAMIGKWHLKSEPTGFNYHNVLPGQGDYYNPDLIEMGERKQYQGYVTDIITDLGIDWLKNRNPEKPFLLMLQHKAPHRSWMPRLDQINMFDSAYFLEPLNFYDDYATRGSAAREQEMEIGRDMQLEYDLKLVKPGQESRKDGTRKMTPEQLEEWDSRYAAKNSAFYNDPPVGKELIVWKYNRYLQDYLACIAAVDEGVGRVLDYLEESGLEGNTVVVYTSDQGFYLGEHGWFDKRFMYEESLHTPLLIRYPGTTPINASNNDLVSNLDFAPTFLDLAGVEIPEDMQGVSFKRLLSTDSGPVRDGFYYHYFEYPAVHSVKRHYGIRTSQYKLIHFYYDDDYWELYDLLFDPFEMNNIYNDPENAGLIDTLKTQLYQLREQYKVPGIEEELGNSFSTIENRALNIPAVYENNPSEKFADDHTSLTDGIINKLNIYSANDLSAWQGFYGEDLIASIDLTEQKVIKEIAVRFRKDENRWIFLPEQLALEFSTDNKNWQPVALKKPEVVSSLNNIEIHQYTSENIDIPVRSLRIHAKNIGTCPEGHPGAGDKAWLFTDEIILN